jgi:hypothetical protein
MSKTLNMYVKLFDSQGLERWTHQPVEFGVESSADHCGGALTPGATVTAPVPSGDCLMIKTDYPITVTIDVSTVLDVRDVAIVDGDYTAVSIATSTTYPPTRVAVYALTKES